MASESQGHGPYHTASFRPVSPHVHRVSLEWVLANSTHVFIWQIFFFEDLLRGIK